MAVLLRKNISGSIDGDAIQKDMTGARGTPPINKEAITGITPQEQNGLMPPNKVARSIDTSRFLLNTLLISFETLLSFTATASGIVTRR